MNKSWVVYRHTSPNGKIYIGITCKKVEHRWNNGKGYIGSPHFLNAINKYGWNNITHEILYKNLERRQAQILEISLIHYYKSNMPEFGYNITYGGEGHSGTFSEEHKKKIGESLRGHVVSKETRQKIAKSIIGMHHSEATKLLFSIQRRGRKLKAETKRKIGESNCKPITVYYRNGSVYKDFASIKEAAQELNVDYRNICEVLRGKQKTFKQKQFYARYKL